MDFVSFSYYSSRCITTDQEILAEEKADGNAVLEAVKNPYLDVYKRQVLALEGAPPGTQPEQQVLDALGEEELTAMSLDLREPYRTPCRLVLREQHTMAEAAQLCGRPPKTVEAQIYRAKKMVV